MIRKINIIKGFILFLIIAVTMVMATACQPTPEEVVVVGKGKEQILDMLDKAVTTPVPTGKSDATPAPILLSYEAPEHLEYTVVPKVDKFNITVDINADVIIPEYALPIVKVKPKKITFEQVSSLVNLIKGDKHLYHKAYAERARLKCDVQHDIDYYKYELSLCDTDKDFYKNKLKKLFEEIEKAPATYEEANIQPETKANDEVFVEKDGTTHTEKAPDDAFVLTEKYVGPFDITEENYDDEYYDLLVGQGLYSSKLLIGTKQDDMYQTIEYTSSLIKGMPRVLDNVDASKLDITLDEAIELAKPYVDSLNSGLVLSDTGIACGYDFSTEEIKIIPIGYKLAYTRKFNGVDTNHTVKNKGWERLLEYRELYPQEYLSIIVTKDGVLLLRYLCPMEVVETISNETEILPFDKIKEIYERHIVMHDMGAEDFIKFKAYLNITRIQLGMMRIPLPDKPDEFLVVPVWDFYGGGSGMPEGTSLEQAKQEARYFHARSYLTINAIDGSIIQRHHYN